MGVTLRSGKTTSPGPKRVLPRKTNSSKRADSKKHESTPKVKSRGIKNESTPETEIQSVTNESKPETEINIKKDKKSYPIDPNENVFNRQMVEEILWKYRSEHTKKTASLKKRRRKNTWTAKEVEAIHRGVESFGEGNWKQIISNEDFHESRTAQDLKDKWRNLMDPRKHTELPMREFHILDENHRTVNIPGTANPIKLTNRWPKLAATKAATRDCFYTKEKPNGPATVWIMELKDNKYAFNGIRKYKVSRERVLAPEHAAHLTGILHIWQGHSIFHGIEDFEPK